MLDYLAAVTRTALSTLRSVNAIGRATGGTIDQGALELTVETLAGIAAVRVKDAARTTRIDHT